MRKAIVLLLALVMLVSVAACSQDDETTMPPVASSSVVVTPEAQIPTNVDPSIQGFITRINYSAESTEILVENFEGEQAETHFAYDKALVKLDGNTALATDRNEALALSALTVGSTVDVWFSDPTAESYPVLVYGQAVRVITTNKNLAGYPSLPQLSVTAGTSALTVVTSAVWNDRTYSFDPLKQQLDETLGAHISVSPGDPISLSFSRKPKRYTVSASISTLTSGEILTPDTNGRILVPDDAEGEMFVRISAEYAAGTVDFAFAMVIIPSAE